MFDKLRTQLQEAIKKIKGEYRFTENNINPPLKEIRRALMAADVHYRVAKKVVQELKRKAAWRENSTRCLPGEVGKEDDA